MAVTNINGKRLLSIRQAAQEFGLTVWGWRNLIWSGTLPVVQLGRTQYIDRKDIERLIENSKVCN